MPSGSWLDTPVALLRAYLRMLPILQAQRTLREAGAISVGSPPQSTRAARAVKSARRNLERQARMPGRSKPARPEELASRGVAVHRVARPPWADRYTRR